MSSDEKIVSDLAYELIINTLYIVLKCYIRIVIKFILALKKNNRIICQLKIFTIRLKTSK